MGLRIGAVIACLAGPGPVPPVSPADLPAKGEVVAAVLDVFDEPDDRAVASRRLQRGDRVTVRDSDRPGWLAIDPPPGSFCWIDESAVGAADALGRARVTADGALVRSGHPLARMPGEPWRELARGTVVQLLKYAPLAPGQGPQRRTWRAIVPPQGDVRHVHASGIQIREEPRPDGASPPAEIRTGYAPPGPQPQAQRPVSPDITDAIARIKSLHRAALRAPVEQWRLDDVRERYEALLKNVTDSAAGSVIRARLDEVARQQAIARDAREIETLLARSRRRDATVALDQRRVADAQKPQARAYDVEGLIQPSSRKIEGRKVFALIGRDGATQAYLDIPPGIDVKGLMTRRVGVRGSVNYDAALRARIIAVREVEALDTETRRE
jgi:hypothetical protein